jgi:DNA-binding helix-hairpin-helix protein with protein kinase domain
MKRVTTVFDALGKPQTLAPQLAEGGEGVIYPLANRDEVLVKLYHLKELSKRGDKLQQKVEAMRAIPGFSQQTGVSWPLISVFDADKRWIGYAMYKADGKPMFNLAHAVLYKRHFPGVDRRGITAYLINLLQRLKELQSLGVMIGDYNLHNILCDPASDRITLIDCDSYQLQAQGTLYPCPVGTPDMTPKEQHGQQFSKLKRTRESEAFSLAIILFKCLMLGRHPYDIVGGDDPVTNLKRGNFAYGIGNRGIPRGPWYNIWSHMPHRLKTQFISTFTEGADNPSKRTSLDEWLETMLLYRKEMDKGWHDTAIQPAEPKSKQYRGTSASLTES